MTPSSRRLRNNRALYKVARRAFEDCLVPPIRELIAEAAAARNRIRPAASMTEAVLTASDTGVTERIRSVERRMEEEFGAIRAELASIRKRIDDVPEIRERLAAIEARFAPRS